MLHGLEVPSEVEAKRIITAVLNDLHSGNHGGVVVDSPRGAGKLTFVVPAATEQTAAGERLIIMACANEQVDHLIDRLMTTAIAARADEVA